MSKEARKNIKRELAVKEHESLLKDVEIIDSILKGGEISHEDSLMLFNKFVQRCSFSESVSWLQPFIESGLLGIQARLDKLVEALNQEFSSSISIENHSEQEVDRYFGQTKAYALIKLKLDGSILLYSLGRNGAALIELHAVMERECVEAVATRVIQPEMTEIGLKLIERLTLPDLSVVLRDCGVADDKDVKFAQNLNKLRNGLAHRNTKVISKAVCSGKEIPEADIDFVMQDVDYISFVLGATNFLVKIMDWEESDIACSKCGANGRKRRD